MTSIVGNKWRHSVLNDVKEVDAKVARWVYVRREGQPSTVYVGECRRLGIQENKGILRILERKEVTELDLSKMYLGPMGILPVLSVVHLLPSLRTLDLSYCQTTSSHVVLLAASIRGHPSLTSLNLSHNPCSSLGLQVLYEALLATSSVTTLALHGVEIVPTLRDKIEHILAAHGKGAGGS